MRSILKALGLTIWGIVAMGLLATFMFVGYESAMRHRASKAELANESTASDQPGRGLHGRSADISSSASASRTTDLSHTSGLAPKPETIHQLLLTAVHNGHYESAIAYGQQLAEGNFAEPGDILVVAQSYSSVGDCENARLWAQKAQDAYQTAKVVPDVSLRSVILCCGRGLENYELAIAAIERGLRKGGIVHLDEAYIYLGRAKVVVGDIEGAREAFSKLKDVPSINPRVLRLWTLYAETQLTTSENWQCPKG